MKFHMLMENTTKLPGIVAEHGLSLYYEEEKLLFDTGQTGAFADNAKAMGLDLSEVQTVVLSHGHYDHGGGILRFFRENQRAPVYIQENAFGSYWNKKGKYIGLAPELLDHPRVIRTGDHQILGPGLELFTCNDRTPKYPILSWGLTKKTPEGTISDEFLHEQYLLIQREGKRVLISGCSHKGICNLVSWFRPDVVIGGFHLMHLPEGPEGERQAAQMAEILLAYPTRYLTCHCTGSYAYSLLKTKMGDRLSYFAAGESLTI